jgi:PAS domain S-box-containing protein
MNATETRVAIVGGGKACHDFLRMIHVGSRRFGLRVVGVADPDPDSAGMRYAREIGVDLITSDFRDILHMERVDLLVELTGEPKVGAEIARALPPHIHFVDHYASRFFWDLFSFAQESYRLRRASEEKALAERNRLQNILDSLPFEILVIGTDYVVQTANRTFLENNRQRLEEVVGHYCYDLEMITRGPCDVSIDGCPHNASLQAGRAVSTVVSKVDPVRGERFASVRAAPIRDDEGNVLGVVETVLDITERVQTEEHLKETRERLGRFIDTAPLLIYMTDANQRIREANTYTLQTLGLEESEVIGKTMRSVLPEPAAGEMHEVERRVLKTGQSARHEGTMTVDGATFHYRATLFPVHVDERVVGLFNLIEDTTALAESERKLAQRSAELSEARQLLRGVLDNSRDLIFLTDTDGVLTSVNKGAETALGFAADDLVGRPVAELSRHPDEFRELFAQTLAEGHGESYEVPFARRDGETVLCNVSLTTIDEQGGAHREVIGICRDITRRRRLQDDLVRSDRLAAIGKMAAGVAHEINNPLAVMEAIAGVLTDTLAEEGHKLHPSSRDMLEKAAVRLRRQVKRCSSITHGLLGFARKSESGLVPVDVNATVDECLDLLMPEIRNAGAVIQRDYAADLKGFQTDPTLLQQILVNLLKNACDAIEETGRGSGVITLTTRRDEDVVSVAVQDDGVGIPAEALDKIFDLFQTSKPVGKGTGLGLAIVHDIVGKLGADIQVESEYGSWTRFTLRLPEGGVEYNGGGLS